MDFRLLRRCRGFMIGLFWLPAIGLSAPVGIAITYQGHLKGNGVPVDGTAAMSFRLFDAPTAGAAASSLLSFPAVSVVNGLFTVDLDFGAAAFAGQERYLQVVVDGTPLTSRQRIAPAPYALHALNAGDGHSLDASDGSPTDAIFVDANGQVGIGTTTPGAALDVVDATGLSLRVNDDFFINSASGFVGVGRSDQLTGAEVFGLRRTGAGFGGMYIETSDAAGMPFYGYATNSSVRAYHYLDSGGGWRLFLNGADRVAIDAQGEVGIGTPSPAAPLDILMGDKRLQFRLDGGLVPGINLTGSGGNLGILRIRNKIEMWPNDAGTTAASIDVRSAAGAVNISLDGGNGGASFAGNLSFGSATRQMLNLWTGEYGIGIQGFTEYFRTGGGFAWFRGGSHSDSTNNPGAGGNVLMALDSSGNLGLGTTTPAAKLDVNGRARVDSLEIVGGADLAEAFSIRARSVSDASIADASHEGSSKFKVQSSNDAVDQSVERERHGSSDGMAPGIEPGTVVVIDSEHPGELRVSSEPHDPKVAGIVSGAKGLAPGMVLRGEGDPNADGRHLVAMTGRAWCKCDTSSGPIHAGDLLTTSANAGHAMRVADDAAVPRGAILGKAMSELTDGTGLVLVLVNLQ